MNKTVLSSVGGIGTAFASALCCAGPILAVTLGISSAGLTATFEPLRPYFLAATAVFLVLGFVMIDREEKAACEPGKLCANPVVLRRMKNMMWVATAMAVLFATYPKWQSLIF